MRCAYVVLLMVLFLASIEFKDPFSIMHFCFCSLKAAYWVTEALPLPITSLMPMVLLPFLGLCSTNEVGINYLKSTNFMFLGGLILALAVEHSGLHQRVALKILLMIGTSPRNLLLGFMITTGTYLVLYSLNTMIRSRFQKIHRLPVNVDFQYCNHCYDDSDR